MGKAGAAGRRAVAALAGPILEGTDSLAMTAALARSYQYCEALTRREAGNFYPAFLLLPAPQRLSMCALYAFMRIADDLSDEPMPILQKRVLLAEWRVGLRQALAGHGSHPSHAALQHTAHKHQ